MEHQKFYSNLVLPRLILTTPFKKFMSAILLPISLPHPDHEGSDLFPVVRLVRNPIRRTVQGDAPN